MRINSGALFSVILGTLLVWVVTLVVFGPGGTVVGPNLPDPDSASYRLAGHWRSRLGDQMYFSPPNPKVDLGIWTLVHRDRSVSHQQYRLLKENRKSGRLTIVLVGPDTWYQVTVAMSPDGRTIKGLDPGGEWFFVDRQTQPTCHVEEPSKP